MNMKHEVRCPKCDRKICEGIMIGETKCPKCHHIFTTNSLVGLKIIGFEKNSQKEIMLQSEHGDAKIYFKPKRRGVVRK